MIAHAQNDVPTERLPTIATFLDLEGAIQTGSWARSRQSSYATVVYVKICSFPLEDSIAQVDMPSFFLVKGSNRGQE